MFCELPLRLSNIFGWLEIARQVQGRTQKVHPLIKQQNVNLFSHAWKEGFDVLQHRQGYRHESGRPNGQFQGLPMLLS